MRRTGLIQILFILLLSVSFSSLFADIANQEKLEAKLRADTEFNGSITWWNDDTIKEMHGWFDLMDFNSSDEAAYITETVEDIFHSLLPYTGLKAEDFNVVDVVGDSYMYRQVINGRYVDQYGYIEIVNMVDECELAIWICPLVNVKAPATPTISKSDAYRIYTQQVDASDVLGEVEADLFLIYTPTASSIDYTVEKPRNLDLVWGAKGKNNDYFVNAISGKLSKRVVLEN